jgi:hypothetical protein
MPASGGGRSEPSLWIELRFQKVSALSYTKTVWSRSSGGLSLG